LIWRLPGRHTEVRTLARVATSSLAALCIGLALVTVVVAALGILGTHWATARAKTISSDELTTSTTTAMLARDMDAAYAVGEEAFLSGSGQRARLLGQIYTSQLPAIDAQLLVLEQLHTRDPAAEHADIERLVLQWTVIRDLLSPTSTAALPAAIVASRLTAAYRPVSAHLDRLIRREHDDASTVQAKEFANAMQTTWLIAGIAVVGIGLGIFLLLRGFRRVRLAVEPGEKQAEFAAMLQIATNEEEAHQLLRRHLERILPLTAAVVLNRNNSADRLEAVTPPPSDSPLGETLRGARPHSCLAVRSGRSHHEGGAGPALLPCPVCTPCPGASSCMPLVVGGEVIGSVLVSRPGPFNESEEERIRESVSQAAPVLANLRNLTIAEIRAATDGLTGLPNKRAVADALKRMFAQASTTGAPLALLLLDLDQFKQVNDRRGHTVGDQVLANVGAVLRTTLRPEDFAGRNGGEEFAVLLPGTETSAALAIAERVCAAISEIRLPGADVQVTTSIGVAAFPEHASTPDRLERLADAALYLAKRHGRNRVELADATAVDAADGWQEHSANDSDLEPRTSRSTGLK
jgi:diguanylate cyclase (GGDEF)-like protein